MGTQAPSSQDGAARATAGQGGKEEATGAQPGLAGGRTAGPQQQPAVKKGGLASVLSGALSGAVISLVLQPFDVIKTRQQADAALGRFAGTAASAKHVVKAGGLRALWRGSQPTVLRLSLGAGVHFFMLERMKAAFLRRREALQQEGQGARATAGAGSGGTGGAGAQRQHVRLTNFEAALIGGVTRGLATAVLCPITVVKTRMEYASVAGSAGHYQYRSTLHALATIARQERVRGLFRGIWPTMLANAPFSALYYMFYSGLQERAKAASPDMDGRKQTAVNFASGTMAAAAATVLTQPFDVIRTRMQLGLTAGSGSVGTVGNILGKQGAAALLTGFVPRVAKRTLQTALVWTLYEELVPRMAQTGRWLAEQTSTGSGPEKAAALGAGKQQQQ